MPKKIEIVRKCYNLASVDGRHAEITMYGNVVETWPVDWWTGEKLEGNWIAGDEFLKDLDAIKNCRTLTIRINSYGGDAVVGMMIHNRLRELARGGMKLTAIVDAVAMSAASVIMAACDTVRINPTGLIMIHRAAAFQFGFYNADDLQQEHDAMVSYDEALANAYVRKTGLSQEEVIGMMAETTYMTGREAVERGFADELIEDAEPLQLAASADGTRIFANGKTIHLAPGMFAPDFIPTADAEPKAEPAEPAVEANTPPVDSGNLTKEETAMDLEQLREQHPDLVQQIEAAAVNAERDRLRAIDEIAGIYSDEMVQAAKYGDPCTAETLAYRAAKAQAKRGGDIVAALEKDAEAVNAVNPAPAPVVTAEPSEADVQAAAGKEAAKAFLAKK